MPLELDGIKQEWTRICPICKQTIYYKLEWVWERALAKNGRCRRCNGHFNGVLNKGKKRTDAYKKECSKRVSGEGNPFYGKKHPKELVRRLALAHTGYKHTKEAIAKIAARSKGTNNPRYGLSLMDCWIRKYGEEEALKREIQWKERLSRAISGKGNPMYGKPSPQGSGNGWKGWYKGWFFRSLLELSYMVQKIEKKGWKWKSADCKALRILYQDYLGRQRTYCADFLIKDKFLVEIKPKKLQNTPLVLAKAKAAKEYCASKGLIYLLKSVKRMSAEDINKLVALGKVKFLSKYQKKLEECLKS